MDTPSPLSPHGTSEQGTFGDAANCRRRLPVQSRPFSELYSEEFVPLDDVDITNPELSQTSQAASDENTLSGNESTEGGISGESRTSSSLANSLEVESPDGTVIDQRQDSQNALDNADGIPCHEGSETSTPTQGPGDNNPDSDNQPMEIPEEINGVNSSEAEMSSTDVGQRNSTGSIELTEDSPLRILEECERVREETIALSRENLLQGPTAESDDELEQMDITDETITTERDSSHNSDYSMDDALTSENLTQSTLNGSSSTETQPMAEQETDLLEAASSGLLDEEVNDAILSSLEEHEGSRTSPAAVECVPGPSVATALIEPETGEMAAEGNLQQPAENTEHNPAEQQEIGVREEPMSLLEYVDQIMDDEPEEQSGDNAMIIESVGDNTQESTSSPGSNLGTSEPSGVDSPSVAVSSVTLPMEASEPVCLGATSVQSTSTSEMIVDTPLTVHSGVGDDDRAIPQRPPRGKRLSRSTSDPRSAHSRRLAERTRNASRGSNQGENSPRLTRPPLIRRVTEPTTMPTNAVDPTIVPVNTGVSSQASNTTAVVTPVTEPVAEAVVLSPTESVVMAVPLSPPQQRSSLSSARSPVVVADVVAEAPALVTPLPSPDLVSERTNSTFDELTAVAAVSLEASGSAAGEASTSRDSPDDYVLIVPSDGRQPSSAPSTLRRKEAASAVDSLLTNGTRASHRRNSSQDNSSVLYATPLSGLGRELPDQQSASFPRPSSSARVTALSGGRRRSSSSSNSGYTVSRAVPDESQSLPRSYGQTASASSSPAAATSATVNPEQVRHNAPERVNNTSPGAASLPGPSSQSGSDLSQSREAIQTMLRSYYIKSTQVPGGQPPVIQPPRASTSSAQEPEAARRPSQPNNRNGNRRSSGRRQQGNPVHVSIQDQQQSREQRARPEQQATEEEPLPPSKQFGGCFRIA